jgi:ADP-heptose:LPS heptosyltransferase
VRELPVSLVESLRRHGRGLTVLVVRLGAMGDVVRTLPAVRLLRRALTEARILWIVDDRWRSILAEHPDLDDIVPFRRGAWDAMLRAPGRWPGIPDAIGRLRRQLRQLGANLVVDFHGNLRSGCVGRLSGAGARLGYAGHQQKEGNLLFTTHRVASGPRRTPRIERNLDLVRSLGLPVAPLPPLDLPLVAQGREAAETIVATLAQRPDGFAVVSPGASRAQAYKKPPLEILAAGCRRLTQRGVLPLIVYGPGEEADAHDLSRRVGESASVAPPTGLAALCALLSRARMFVGGDSGPLHLACATACPVIGIYGPTDPQVNQPWGVPYTALAAPGRKYTGIKRLDRKSGGFEGLTPTQMDAAVDELLDRTSRASG